MSFWIEGRYFSIEDCPDCITWEGYECDLCDFFVPEDCPLLNDPFLLSDLRSDYLRRLRFIEERRLEQEKLIRALVVELRAHGRPLHYSLLTRMIADRYPKLNPSLRSVSQTLSAHPNVFYKVVPGVYAYKNAR